MMATAWMLTAMLLGSGARLETRAEVQVDLLEVNTLYNARAQPVFVQVIAWRFFPEDRMRPHNVGWRMLTSPSDWPTRVGSRWCVTVGDGPRRVTVWAKHFRASHTQTDVERDDTRAWWGSNRPENVFEHLLQPLPEIESTDAP
jgi:hypothetical protein